MIKQLKILANDPSTGFETNLPQVSATGNQLQYILQIVFGVLAVAAVLMIVVAGLRFVTAQGNPQEVGKAKNTIVYALIGLLVAVVAQAIVSLVLFNI